MATPTRSSWPATPATPGSMGAAVLDSIDCPVPPHRLSGTVLVALLNHPGHWQALGDAVHAPPYKAPPQAPVLGVKPRNTWAGDGACIAVPPEGVVLAASLGLVIGRSACAVAESQALAHVAGYVVGVDLHLPLANPQRHYRPGLRQRVRDGFCPMGPAVRPAAALAAAGADPDALAVTVCVDGDRVAMHRTAGHRRNVAQLVADVSAFMTLHPGDVLFTGAAPDMPVAHAGRQVVVEIAHVGCLRFRLVPEPEDDVPPGAETPSACLALPRA